MSIEKKWWLKMIAICPFYGDLNIVKDKAEKISSDVANHDEELRFLDRLSKDGCDSSNIKINKIPIKTGYGHSLTTIIEYYHDKEIS
ncbi:MAG: hypothetical protein M1338_02795 [Patescibacteria group bacterium]|nr:hypothetical protein [Patescibacteria group bacterium]